jgi:formylglycine-generating enzyme required for sulfatase activity
MAFAVGGCRYLIGLTDRSDGTDPAEGGTPPVDAGPDVFDAGTTPADECAPGDECRPQRSCRPVDGGAFLEGTGLDCASNVDGGDGGGVDCCLSLPVPGGTVTVGSQTITVSPFQLDAFEVTLGRFRRFALSGAGTSKNKIANGAGAHPKILASGWNENWTSQLLTSEQELLAELVRSSRSEYGTWTSPDDKYPASTMTWFEAFAFCYWDGGRLPTDAEWTFAAAGTTSRTYPWGSALPDAGSYATFCPTGPTKGGGPTPSIDLFTCNTTPLIARVGALPAGDGPFGHHDLGGNLFEWVLDWNTDSPPSPCKDCGSVLPDPAQSDRVLRGGSYRYTEYHLRNVTRDHALPGARKAAVSTAGFRCAHDFK